MVYPAGDGFRPKVADWAIRAKKTFDWDKMVLTSDREYTIAKAIHEWHGQEGRYLVRYYGWYSHRRRGMRAKLETAKQSDDRVFIN